MRTPKGPLVSASRVQELKSCAAKAGQNFEIVRKLYAHFLKKDKLFLNEAVTLAF